MKAFFTPLSSRNEEKKVMMKKHFGEAPVNELLSYAEAEGWEYYDIVEDSYEYERGLMIIGYDSEDAERGYCDGELGHFCLNLDEYAA